VENLQPNDTSKGSKQMKRAIVVALILGLIAGALAAPAAAQKKKKKKKNVRVERVVEGMYETPAIGHPDVIVGCAGTTGCATIGVAANERFVKIEIEDASGLPVYATAGQDLDGDQLADKSFSFCGTTGEEPMEIEPGFEINIFISAGPGVRKVCPGAATGPGKAIATLSNLP
jgi:hypothetical protein